MREGRTTPRGEGEDQREGEVDEITFPEAVFESRVCWTREYGPGLMSAAFHPGGLGTLSLCP